LPLGPTPRTPPSHDPLLPSERFVSTSEGLDSDLLYEVQYPDLSTGGLAERPLLGNVSRASHGIG